MRTRFGTLLLVASLALTACRGGGVAPLPSTNNLSPASGDIAMPLGATGTANSVALCGPPLPGRMQCYALRRTDVGAISPSAVSALAGGYGPADLLSAYKIPKSTSTPTVAIVDAYDDPYAASDLAQYRSTFGLPPCGTGCFTKMSQTGSTTVFPPSDSGWAGEESLDVDMVSAICPTCHILLVEANDSTGRNLALAVDKAAAQPGVVAISNSYGGSESQSANSNYNHKGIVITASTGDNGYGLSQPASFATVVAVGGTHLSRATNTRGWNETGWSCSTKATCNTYGGAGSGCSATVAKPAWQTDTGCTMAAMGGKGGRSEGDISAVADPSTGVWVYNTYDGGLVVYGGTSVSSPLVAAMFAVAGNGATITSNGSGGAAKYIWQHHSSSNMTDVITGTNAPSAMGNCATAWTYICRAGTGYDGLTGWGTPLGLGAL